MPRNLHPEGTRLEHPSESLASLGPTPRTYRVLYTNLPCLQLDM